MESSASALLQIQHQQKNDGDRGAPKNVGGGRPRTTRHSHDTISMVALDTPGHMAAASSSNGASHKVDHLTVAEHLVRLHLSHSFHCVANGAGLSLHRHQPRGSTYP